MNYKFACSLQDVNLTAARIIPLEHKSHWGTPLIRIFCWHSCHLFIKANIPTWPKTLEWLGTPWPVSPSCTPGTSIRYTVSETPAVVPSQSTHMCCSVLLEFAFLKQPQNLFLTSFWSFLKRHVSVQRPLVNLSEITILFPNSLPYFLPSFTFFLAYHSLKHKYFSQASGLLSASLVRLQTPGGQEVLPILWSVVSQVPEECLGCSRCSINICWIHDDNSEISRKGMMITPH